MLHTLTKRWYLCCYTYWPRTLNVNPNIYSRERSFLFKGNSTIQCNHNKTNKQRGIFMHVFLFKNSSLSNQITYCSSLSPMKTNSLPKQWITYNFSPNAQHKQRHEGSTSTTKRQASKSHFYILDYVFPLEK